MTEWLKRPYGSHKDDEDGVIYQWIRSYAHSSYGMHQGAHKRHTPEAFRFWEQHRPFILALMRSSEITLACDAGAEHVIWGWLATQGDTVHYCFVKRSVVKAGLGLEIVKDLLGERLTKQTPYTMELVEMRRVPGLYIPRQWYPDFTFHTRGLAA